MKIAGDDRENLFRIVVKIELLFAAKHLHIKFTILLPGNYNNLNYLALSYFWMETHC